MKRSVVWILLSYSVLGLTGIPVRAQETGSEKETLVVEPGSDFRAALEKGVCLKAVGQPITAKLLEPVYAGEVLAIPPGSTIKGHVSAISTAPMRKRARRLLNGDFTPPKTAQVTFDQLVLSDGTIVPIHSDSAVGLGSVANSRYLPKAQRPGMRQKLKSAMAPLREPNKLQRFGEAVVTSLPYHPEYIDQGTVFDTALLEPVTLLAPVEPDTASLQASDYLHLHLLTPINSSTSSAGTQIEAVVSQPYYQADHQLLYPAGCVPCWLVLGGSIDTSRHLNLSLPNALSPGIWLGVDEPIPAVRSVVAKVTGSVKTTIRRATIAPRPPRKAKFLGSY
jgi:hypothetical protein